MNFAGKTYAELGLRLPGAVGRTSVASMQWTHGLDVEAAQGCLVEPYKRSAWVQGAIKKISGPVASVAVDFYSAESGYSGIGQVPAGGRSQGKRYLTGRGRMGNCGGCEVKLPVLEQFLRSPMRRMGWSDIVEATIGWRKMAGESFWILPDSVLLPFPEAKAGVQVVLARPDRMRHVVDGGEIAGWVFTDKAGRSWNLLPEQVIQLARWNPYDEFRGLSEFEACRMAAESDWMAGRFAKNLMGNNGDTGPYIVAKAGVPSDEQRQQILADLRGKRAAQQRGDFRPVFLTGDISVEDPQVRSVDAAFIAGRIENRHEIAAALGVPPSMFDVKAAYSIGSASDFYQLILNTCVPEGDKICDGLVELARRLTGIEVEAFLDWDEHPVFQEVRKERLSSVDTLWTKGVPLGVVDEYLGLGLPDFPGKDVGYLPFGVAPVDGGQVPAVDPAVDPALGEPADPGEEMPVGGDVCPTPTGPGAGTAVMMEALRARVAAVEDGCCGWDVEDCVVRGRDPKEIAQWKDLMAKRRGTVRLYEGKLGKVAMAARAETLRRLELHGPVLLALNGVKRAAGADFVFDLVKFRSGLLTAMRGAAESALQTAGEHLYGEIGRDEAWRMPAPRALEFFKSRENKLANVADGIHEDVMGTLDEGLRDGDTMAQLAGRVRAQFNEFTSGRALTIARTETGAAFGVARDQAMRDAGIPFKRWLTSGNSKVRLAHKQMNGAIVPAGEKFVVADPKGGEVDEVDHPGDPDGLPWNVINCACVCVPSLVDEAGK